MVYTSQEINEQLLENQVVAAAKKIYLNYYRLHGQNTKTPIGVAVDEKTYRGQLLFTKVPILLPGECFIPITDIKAEK